MSVLSKLSSAPFNCYEISHPLTESCAEHSASVFLASLQHAVVLYGGLYTFNRLISGKLGLADIFHTAFQVLQSSTFLSINACVFTSLICKESRLTGRVNVLTPSTAAVISSLMAIHLETPARRRLLAIYLLNIISETFYESVRSRGILKPIRYFEVLLYAVSMAAYFRRATSPKSYLVNALMFLAGRRTGVFAEERITPAAEVSGELWTRLKSLSNPPTHDCADRKCISHTVRTGIRAFACGFAASLVSSLPAFVIRGSSVRLGRASRLGLFLAATAIGTNAIQCLVQNTPLSQVLSAKTALTIAVFVSSFSMAIFPSRSVALHVFWHTLAFYSRFDRSPHPLPEVIYSICCSILAFFVVFEPQAIRASYLKFLDGLSGDRLSKINRHPLEVYSGCHSSKMYPDYFPQLNLARASPRFLEMVLLWSVQ